jgi:signal transduction histidine kinase
VVQALVLAIDAGHTVAEETGLLAGDSGLYLLSVSLLLVPVVYAALGFGLRGAVPTALWALVLSVPEISQHAVTTRIGILIQFAILLAIAVTVAVRVDRERAALASLTATKRNLETYIELATDAQEEERKRLSRELHDDILQSLVVAKSTIESAGGTEHREEAHRRLGDAQGLLAEVIVDLRRYCRDLRPSLLDDLGLVDAIDWLVGDLRTRTHLVVDLEAAGVPHRLHSKDELLIFRIVQEALHNVERHSRATHAQVRLAYAGGALVVSVSDDGRGMDREGAGSGPGGRADPGLGLRGMQERANLLRGTLTIRSRPGEGTELSLLVPLPAAEPAPSGRPA